MSITVEFKPPGDRSQVVGHVKECVPGYMFPSQVHAPSPNEQGSYAYGGRAKEAAQTVIKNPTQLYSVYPSSQQEAALPVAPELQTVYRLSGSEALLWCRMSIENSTLTNSNSNLHWGPTKELAHSVTVSGHELDILFSLLDYAKFHIVYAAEQSQ